MKLFADTANLQEIEELLRTGAIQGITTNPSLLSKEPKADFLEHIQKICDLCQKYEVDLPVSVEVFATEPDSMIEQAAEICEKIQYNNINIKIPVGFQELRVISELAKRGIRVNCTCCFTDTQLQLAALAGAKYVSLFYNRLIDVGGDPLEALRRVRKFIEANDLDCEIISGSIRNAYDLSDCWANGSHIVTAGFGVIKKSTQHVKTNESIEGFIKDFEAWIK
jgi:transaldolase